MRKLYLKMLVAMAMFVVGSSAWAQDPDLNDYSVLKTLDFSKEHWGGQNPMTALASSSLGKVNGVDVYDVTEPSEYSGYLALQGISDNGTGNGWWIRVDKGDGLWSYGAGRSGMVYNLKAGYIVKITCSQAVGNVVTLTAADNFTSTTSTDGNSYFCTMSADGYIGFSGAKSAGYITSITIYIPAGELLPPTAELTKVSAAGKTYTITNPNPKGTLYYTTSVDTDGTEAPNTGDEAYSSTEEQTAEVTISESGNLYAYVVSGSITSDIVTVAVNGTKETLNAPTITLSGMAEADGEYYPVVSIAHEATVNGFTPEVTISYDLDGEDITEAVKDNAYTFTSIGTLTVTVTSDGYSENTASYTVAYPYSKEYNIDIASITEEDIDETYWTKNETGDNDARWGGSDAAPLTYYTLVSADHVSDALEGITLWWDDARKPSLYIGKGIMYPYASTKPDNSEVKYTNGTEEQIAIWTYIKDYGKNTLTTITAGNKPFSLYRYSDMLQKVEIYSPIKPEPEQTSDIAIIGETGYTTFASAHALDLSQLPEGVKAYYVIADGIADGIVTLTEATGTAAAGEGLIIAGEVEQEVEIPFADDEAEALAGNLLVGCTEETQVDINADKYVLVSNEGVAEFRNLSKVGATIPAGKAYLDLTSLNNDDNTADDAAEARRLIIVLPGADNTEGDATAIELVEIAPAAQSGVFYNLAGQRVTAPAKGIYIVNGKKVLVK